MTGPPPPSNPPGSGPDWGKLTKATGADRLILIAGGLLLIDSFLAWFTLGPFSANMWNGIGTLAGILCILTVAFAAVRVLGVNFNMGSMKDGTVYLITGGGTALFAIIRFLLKPGGLSWGYGAYIGVLLSIALGVGAFQKFQAGNK